MQGLHAPLAKNASVNVTNDCQSARSAIGRYKPFCAVRSSHESDRVTPGKTGIVVILPGVHCDVPYDRSLLQSPHLP